MGGGGSIMREIEKEEDSAGRVTGCQPRMQSILGRIKCATFEGLQTDAGIFNTSRRGHGRTLYRICRWSTATFMMLTAVAEQQSAQTQIGNLI